MDTPRSELEFSFARFAEGFDEHIKKSIRGYDDLLADCVAISEYFIEDATFVLDIGCSTGNFLAKVWEGNRHRAPRAEFVGVDIEPNFRVHWQRFDGSDIKFCLTDIRSFSIPDRCSFVTSIFSLQFISERDRQAILNRIYAALVPGGALVVAEKTFSRCSKLQEMLTSVHYDYKRRSFSDTEILEKERSLRSQMKLWSEEQIIQSLADAGFARANVQSFWRNHSFAGFIALRSG